MKPLEQLDRFHKTKYGYLIFGLIELALLYIAVSIAIDTANMWVYATGIVLSLGVIVNFVNLAKLQFKKSKSGVK